MKLIGEFSIKYLPKTINAIGRSHWTVKSNEAKRCKDMVWEQCARIGIVGERLQKATLEFTRHSFKEPDFDGLVSSFKHIIDGLTVAGVIEDDKPSVIGSPVFKWEWAPKMSGYISIKVFTEDLACPDKSEQSVGT